MGCNRVENEAGIKRWFAKSLALGVGVGIRQDGVFKTASGAVDHRFGAVRHRQDDAGAQGV